jgi:hypothetical protein
MNGWVMDGRVDDKRRVVASAAGVFLSLVVVPSWLDDRDAGADRDWGHVMRLPVRATIRSGKSGWRALIGHGPAIDWLPACNVARLSTGQATIAVVVNHHDAACPLAARSLLFPPLLVPDGRRLFLFLSPFLLLLLLLLFLFFPTMPASTF